MYDFMRVHLCSVYSALEKYANLTSITLHIDDFITKKVNLCIEIFFSAESNFIQVIRVKSFILNMPLIKVIHNDKIFIFLYINPFLPFNSDDFI